jgi:hypothetical protein
MKNHYATLGISPSASLEQIQNAYTNAVIKANGQPNFESRFDEIQEAYNVLSNPTKRKEFDAALLNFYTGKYTINPAPSDPSSVNQKPAPKTLQITFVTFLQNLRSSLGALWHRFDRFIMSNGLGDVFAWSFWVIVCVVVCSMLYKACSYIDDSSIQSTSNDNHDITPGEFNNTSEGGHTNTKNHSYKPSVIDSVLLDSINLVNAGYEIRQLKNGAEPDCFNYTPRKSKIDNKLEVYVGYGTDVAVKLIDKETENCIRYFYVNSGSTYTIYGIPQGVYYLKLAYGSQWMMTKEGGQCKGKFLRNAVYEIGDETLDYNFKYTSEGHSVPSYRLSLGVSTNFDNSDNFNSSKIDESQFNN